MADLGITEGILLAMSAAASVASGVTSYTAGQASKKNAQLEAQQAEAVGMSNAQRQRRIVASQQAALRAETGAYGTTGIGSPMEVYIENVKQGELQAQDEIYRGKIGRQSKLQEARNAQAAGTSGLISGIGQAAGTLGTAYSNYRTRTPAPTKPVP